MQSKILALALFALLAATVVDAGCCNDYCDGLFSTASNCDATEPKKDVAGCGSDNQEGNCDCTWRYDGDKSESNGCTSITATGGSSESKTWACTSALDYGSNGKCVDQWESFGEALTAGFALAGGLLIGIIVAAVVVPIVIIILIVWCLPTPASTPKNTPERLPREDSCTLPHSGLRRDA